MPCLNADKTSKTTATRDLQDLLELEVLKVEGEWPQYKPIKQLAMRSFKCCRDFNCATGCGTIELV